MANTDADPGGAAWGATSPARFFGLFARFLGRSGQGRKAPAIEQAADGGRGEYDEAGQE